MATLGGYYWISLGGSGGVRGRGVGFWYPIGAPIGSWIHVNADERER